MKHINFFPEWYIERVEKRTNTKLNVFCLIFAVLNIVLIFDIITNISRINVLEDNIQVLKENKRSFKNLSNAKNYTTINTIKYFMSLKLDENSIRKIDINKDEIKLSLITSSFEEYMKIIKKLEMVEGTNLKYITPLVNDNDFELVLVRNDKN